MSCHVLSVKMFLRQTAEYTQADDRTFSHMLERALLSDNLFLFCNKTRWPFHQSLCELTDCKVDEWKYPCSCSHFIFCMFFYILMQACPKNLNPDIMHFVWTWWHCILLHIFLPCQRLYEIDIYPLDLEGGFSHYYHIISKTTSFFSITSLKVKWGLWPKWWMHCSLQIFCPY